MSFLASLNSRFKIGTRIGAGFALILVLLVAVAIKGYFALESTIGAFKFYNLVSTNSLRVTEIEGDFADIRRNLLLYTQGGDVKLQAQVHDIAKKLNETIEEPSRIWLSLNARRC